MTTSSQRTVYYSKNNYFFTGEEGSGPDEIGKYNVVFTVDSDVKMNVSVHYMCTEEVRTYLFRCCGSGVGVQCLPVYLILAAP